MDLDEEDGQLPPDDTSGRPSGFRRALKRIRNAFAPRPSNKAVKPSSSCTAGQVAHRSEAQTPSPILKYAETQDQSPDPRDLLLDQAADQQLQHESALPAAVSQHDAVQTSLLAFRPRLPHVAVSEGNIITCPAEQHSVVVSRPASMAASDDVGTMQEDQLTSNGPQHIVLPPKKARAAALFGKYGLELDPEGHFADDATEDGSRDVQRVNKPAKVRIHHHCHRCTMAIGSNGTCIVCGHRRCRKCDRWPHRRPESGSRNSGETRRSMPSPVPSSTRTETLDNWLANPRPQPQSSRTLSSFFTRGDVFSTRNVRRLCHQCHSPFIWTETRCQDCNHRLCKECPRDPPRTPPSTSIRRSLSPRTVQVRPRERVMKKPRIRVRYTCDLCNTVFQEGNRQCGNCGHMRCHNCSRYPPRSEPSREPTVAAVEAFRRRMESMP